MTSYESFNQFHNAHHIVTMSTKALVFTLILTFVLPAYLIPLFPSNPCPNIFQYKYNGSIWFGIIELTDGFRFGDSNMLVIDLGYPNRIRPDYPGLVGLAKTREETIERIILRQPIQYHVDFPVQHPFPKVVRIMLNDRVVCASASSETRHIKLLASLEHGLYTQLAAQKLAALFASVTEVPHFEESSNKPAEVEPEVFNDDSPTNCGQIDDIYHIKPLIIGGLTISKGTWPWLTAIYLQSQKSTRFLCGGNLISAKVILTAAHCFDDHFSIHNYIVLLGRHDITKWNELGSKAKSIEDIYFYPTYNSEQVNFDADVAIVVLRSHVRFTKLIRPVCLPAVDQQIKGKHGIVVGWGQNQDEPVSSEPRRVSVNIVADEICIKSNPQFRLLISNRTFCAGNRDGNGPCSGDSGNGLMVQVNDRWTIIGLVSAALSDPNKNDCDLNEYVVYADVRKFLDWIDRITKMI